MQSNTETLPNGPVPPRSVSWLHISDLHFGVASHEWYWPNVREELFADLKRLLHRLGGVQFVIFSGDIVAKGRPDEFEKASHLLEQLWSVLDTAGRKPFLFTLPGNHDLLRPAPDDASALLFRRWHEEDAVRQSFFNNPTSPYRVAVDNAFRHYSQWALHMRSRLGQPPPFVDGMLPGDSSVTFEHEGIRVGVVGLNSSFLQMADGDYKGKLLIHPAQINAVTNNDPPRWTALNDLNLLVTHHPPSWLHPDTAEDYRSEIYVPNRYAAHLCGHLHDHDQNSLAEAGFPSRTTIQAASLLGLKTWGRAQQRSHGYALYRFEATENSQVLRVWPRHMIRTKPGHLKMVPCLEFGLDDTESYQVALSQRTAISPTTLKEKQAREGSDNVDVEDQVLNSASALMGIFQGTVTEETAKKYLSGVPRHKLQVAPENLEIRLFELDSMKQALTNHRASWLIADWGLGKDEFLAVALQGLTNGAQSYRIDCADVQTRDEFLTAVSSQFGMPLQQFCAPLTIIRESCVILDNIQVRSGDLRWIEEIEDLVQSILEYCSYTHVVLISRKAPSQTKFQSVTLKPLDAADTRVFVEKHPFGGPEVAQGGTIEKSHTGLLTAYRCTSHDV